MNAMRRLRYHVATSIDGFIAGPRGDYDWIVPDPTIDFGALFAEFDTFLMGRLTFELVQSQGSSNPMAGHEVVVVSRTLRQSEHPTVTIVGQDVSNAVGALKSKPGKDIWLFGGGILFRTLLDANLVDTVELAVIPILLSEGIPLLPPGARSPKLRLTHNRVLPSGIVMLAYELEAGSPIETGAA
jgi:dihydrofolate reductase